MKEASKFVEFLLEVKILRFICMFTNLKYKKCSKHGCLRQRVMARPAKCFLHILNQGPATGGSTMDLKKKIYGHKI